MGDDGTLLVALHQNVRNEARATQQLQYTPHTLRATLSVYGPMREDIAVMHGRSRECEATSDGLHGAADQQCQQRVHHGLTAIQNAREQRVRLEYDLRQ